MDSSQMHATLGLHVNKLDVKTIGEIHLSTMRVLPLKCGHGCVCSEAEGGRAGGDTSAHAATHLKMDVYMM